MSEAKHTPGPWKVRKEWHGDGKEVYPDRKVSLGQPSELCVVTSLYDECAANARLIAASPALYEALKTAEAHLYAHRLPIDPAITAALSLAEGKEQA